MVHSSRPRYRLLLSLLVGGASGLVSAQSPVTSTDGQSLRDRARVMETEANRQLERDTAECHQQFLVNQCLGPAKLKHRQAITEARRLDLEGSTLLRSAKLQEKAERQQKEQIEAQRREAEHAARAERAREKRERREVSRQQDSTDDESRAAAFGKKHAEKEARRRTKDAESATELTRREAATRNNAAAEREREYAERTAKVAERKKNYAEKLEREAADKAREQAAREAALTADKERLEFWSLRRWFKD